LSRPGASYDRDPHWLMVTKEPQWEGAMSETDKIVVAILYAVHRMNPSGDIKAVPQDYLEMLKHYEAALVGPKRDTVPHPVELAR
jgi:hypothetical protein